MRRPYLTASGPITAAPGPAEHPGDRSRGDHAGGQLRAARPVTSLVAALLAACAVAGCSGSTSDGGRSPSGAGGGASGSRASASALPAGVEQLENTYQSVISQVLPSVVEIRASRALGSGVIFDDQGNIVTNAHVVSGNTRFKVYLSGRPEPVDATLVAAYPPDDLAVIRLGSAEGARPARFAGMNDVTVGDLVLAMGNPLGLASTVTNGIVSAVGRTVTEPAGDGTPGTTIPNTIQTSAAINPGNSGGALVNLRGQVIGIPTLGAISPQTGGAAPGIGFAISADTVRRIAPQLIRDGKVTDSGRAALGLTATTLTDASGQPAGVGVVEVTSGGPAERAGLRAGDIVTAVAGQPTPTTQALATALAEQKVGQAVPVAYRRDGSEHAATITLGSL
jgi:putative serine protease PepD